VDRNRCRELGYQALEEYEDGLALSVRPDELQAEEPESVRRDRRPRDGERPAWLFAPAPDGSPRGIPPS
jgi:hypothetical protein